MPIIAILKNEVISLITSTGTVIELDDATDTLLIKPNGKLDTDSYIFSLKDQQVTVRYTPRDFEVFK